MTPRQQLFVQPLSMKPGFFSHSPASAHTLQFSWVSSDAAATSRDNKPMETLSIRNNPQFIVNVTIVVVFVIEAALDVCAFLYFASY
jgi:hypothetical protein